ncbi:serine/threonine-protein kinase [Actinokineospora soli]|uniref:non-specific serine/threonine protein kinase n=1 Tax=Actinokineospora soli TaxID=1048753 RepID=A0ABW2TVN4_9PSEU
MLPSVSGLAFVRPLGQGGFGTVHLARQHRLERDVAVKLDNRVLATERDRARFLREARAAARLSGHPNVVNVYDAGVAEDGRPYIVMELCTGGSLADVLRERGPLPVEEVVEMGARLADALARMHAIGILHRDIKPANILVNAFGAVKLADFGLAAILDAHAESTITVGALSPHYAAPEVFAHAAPSPRATSTPSPRPCTRWSPGACPATSRGPPTRWTSSSAPSTAPCRRSRTPPTGSTPRCSAPCPPTRPGGRRRRRSCATSSPACARPLRSPTRPARPRPGDRGGAGRARARRRRVRRPRPAPRPHLGRRAAQDRPAHDDDGPSAGMSACAGHETDGYCVADQCFGGIVSTADMQFVARPTPCHRPHMWQAFSGLTLPQDAVTMTGTQIMSIPVVATACSAEVMAARATGDVSGWRVELLPSADRATALCLGGEPGEPSTGSAFGTG